MKSVMRKRWDRVMGNIILVGFLVSGLASWFAPNTKVWMAVLPVFTICFLWEFLWAPMMRGAL